MANSGACFKEGSTTPSLFPVNSPNCLPRDRTAASHAKIATKMIPPTKGVLNATEPKTIRSNWWKNDPPDLPILDPTPSIAAFPFSLHSELKGIKDISFVTSKKVNFVARDKQFCIDPKKAHITSGVTLKNAQKAPTTGTSLNNKNTKNKIAVTSKTIGVV